MFRFLLTLACIFVLTCLVLYGISNLSNPVHALVGQGLAMLLLLPLGMLIGVVLGLRNP